MMPSIKHITRHAKIKDNFQEVELPKKKHHLIDIYKVRNI